MIWWKEKHFVYSHLLVGLISPPLLFHSCSFSSNFFKVLLQLQPHVLSVHTDQLFTAKCPLFLINILPYWAERGGEWFEKNRINNQHQNLAWKCCILIFPVVFKIGKGGTKIWTLNKGRNSSHILEFHILSKFQPTHPFEFIQILTFREAKNYTFEPLFSAYLLLTINIFPLRALQTCS